MASLSEVDARRRQFLLYALASGALTGLAGCASGVTRSFEGPREMPASRSIYELGGVVNVNNVPANLETLIRPGDVVSTGSASYVIFVLNKDAFILRSGSEMTMAPAGAGTGYQLDKGKALLAMASRQTAIRTPTALIGIRGTGVYVESDPGVSYVCTCYGKTDLSVASASGISESIAASHHDAPRYIIDDGSQRRIEPAPFKNHDDQELLLIETLVGRTTPYVVPRRLPRARTSYL